MDAAIGESSPLVAVSIDKILGHFRTYDLSIRQGVSYFIKPGFKSLSREEFILLVQSLNIKFTSNDLEELYNYIDDGDTGEVQEQVFVEKLESLKNFSLAKLKKKRSLSESMILEEETSSESTRTLKQQVFSIFQRIFFTLQSKSLTKKQMVQQFDKNGNGMINRSELCNSLKLLNAALSFDCLKVLINTLDSEETGVIEVNELIRQLFSVSPNTAGSTYQWNLVLQLCQRMVERLLTDKDAVSKVNFF